MTANPKAFDDRLPSVDAQAQQALKLGWQARDSDLSVAMVARQPSMLAAINMCVQASGIEDYKIARQLGLDKAHWSKIKSGHLHFPPNLLAPLMAICGNYAPLQWLANAVGFDPTQLHPLRSDLEKKLEATQAALEESRRENQMMMTIIRRTRAD